MKESDKDLVFSESVKAGKRIYYFDVKQSRNGENYIAITESKKINEGTFENPHFVYEKHKLFLYKEDYEKFVNALNLTIGVANGGPIPEKEEPEDATAEEPTQTPEPVAAEVKAEEPAAEETTEKKGLFGKMLDIF